MIGKTLRKKMPVSLQVHIVLMFKCIMQTSARTKSEVFPNIGPKACENFCFRTVGCFGFQYSKEFLACRVPKTFRQDEAEPHFVSVPMRKDKDDDVSMIMPPCQARFRKLFSKKGFLKCLKGSPSTHDDSSLRSPISKVLLFSQTGDAFQLENFKGKPSRSSKVNYNMPPSYYFVQYLPVSQMLLFFTTRDYLVFVPYGSEGSNNFHTVKSVLASDATDDAIFYVWQHDEIMLYKMNQYGKNSIFINNLEDTPQGMTIDRKNKVIFISRYTLIRKYTYTGHDIGYFYLAVTKMYYDIIANVVFAQSKGDDNIYVLHYNEMDVSTSRFIFDRTVHDMCAHNNSLYIIDEEGGLEVLRPLERYRPSKEHNWHACSVIP